MEREHNYYSFINSRLHYKWIIIDLGWYQLIMYSATSK